MSETRKSPVASRDMPVTIRGVSYPTLVAAAEALGLSLGRVQSAVRAGREQYLGVPSWTARSRAGVVPIPVKIRGKVYPSAKAAAKALNISEATITKLLTRGRVDYAGMGRSRKHTAGPRSRPGRNAVPVKIAGLSWPSIRAASIALGVGEDALRSHLRSGGTEWLAAVAMRLTTRLEREQAAAARKAEQKMEAVCES